MAERNNELDAFDQHVRGTLEQFEVPYNSADWAQLERALNGERRGWWLSGTGLAAMLVSGALVVGAAAYVLSSNGHPGEQPGLADAGANTPAAQQPQATNGTASSGVANNNGAANGGANDPRNGNANGGNDTSAPLAGGGMYAAGTASRSTAVATETRPNSTGTRPTETRTTAATLPKNAAANTPRSTPVLTSTHSTTTNAAAKAEPTFHASLSEGCPGAPVHFKVEHMPEDGIYLWNFGDGSFSNKANPEHTFTKPGNYQVMLSMSATGVGTIHNKPSSDMIVIHEAPKAAFNVLKQEYDGHIPSVHFENRTMGGKSYVWSFGDGGTSEIAHPDHIYKKKGIYQVELTVTNEIGCVDKTLHEVRIEKDYNLDAPASFSPNGDGTNETFIPEALRQLGVKFHLAVYDPNGGLVYETSDATKPWTGRTNNRGDVLPAGEYVWVVDVSESLHLAETYTGKVQLVR